jgi:hypothetical protein
MKMMGVKGRLENWRLWFDLKEDGCLVGFSSGLQNYMRHKMHCNKYKHTICQFNLHFK